MSACSPSRRRRRRAAALEIGHALHPSPPPRQYDAGVVPAAQLPYLGGTPGPLAKGLTKDVALIPRSDVDVDCLPDLRVSPAGHASKAGLEEAKVRTNGARAHAVFASSHRAGRLGPFPAVGGSLGGGGGAAAAAAARGSALDIPSSVAAELGPSVRVGVQHPPFAPQPALFESSLALDATSTSSAWFQYEGGPYRLNSLYLPNAIAGIFTVDMVEVSRLGRTSDCNGGLIDGIFAEVGQPVSLAGAHSLIDLNDFISADDSDDSKRDDITPAAANVPRTRDEMSKMKVAASCPFELNDTARSDITALCFAICLVLSMACIASLFVLLAVERRRKIAARGNESIAVTVHRGSDGICSLGQTYVKLSGRIRLAVVHRYICVLFISVAALSIAAGELLGDQADKVCYIHAFMQSQ